MNKNVGVIIKKIIINKIMKYIKKNTNYNKEKIKEIEYGLVSIYLTIYKLIIIITISLILNIFKEALIFLLLFNILRTFAFGLHATKSWICLLSSTVMFVGIPFLSKYLIIGNIPKLIILTLGIILIIKNSPADTKKRPIVNKKRRIFFKITSTLLVLIYSILCFIINDSFIINCMVFSIILENILISPTVYRIFKMPYNNYIYFLKTHSNYAE